MRAAVPLEKRVSTSLWRLAAGDCYRTCGLMMGVSKSTAIECCHEFVHELNSLQGDFTRIEGFSQISKIPNVVAAIDWTHIPIKAPQNNHEDYFNRKHFYSYVMQAVVDSHGLYLSVSTRYPGSLHDAWVLRLSEMFYAAENENFLMELTLALNGTVIRPLIVGDSAYPLKTWLLRPVKDNGTLTREQKKFNKQLSKARIVSEHAIGKTGRWRVLDKRLDKDSDRIPDTIIAACVLHNICTLRGEDYDVSDDSDDSDSEDDEDPTPGANATLQAVVNYVSDLCKHRINS